MIDIKTRISAATMKNAGNWLLRRLGRERTVTGIFDENSKVGSSTFRSTLASRSDQRYTEATRGSDTFNPDTEIGYPPPHCDGFGRCLVMQSPSDPHSMQSIDAWWVDVCTPPRMPHAGDCPGSPHAPEAILDILSPPRRSAALAAAASLSPVRSPNKGPRCSPSPKGPLTAALTPSRGSIGSPKRVAPPTRQAALLSAAAASADPLHPSRDLSARKGMDGSPYGPRAPPTSRTPRHPTPPHLRAPASPRASPLSGLNEPGSPVSPSRYSRYIGDAAADAAATSRVAAGPPSVRGVGDTAVPSGPRSSFSFLPRGSYGRTEAAGGSGDRGGAARRPTAGPPRLSGGLNSTHSAHPHASHGSGASDYDVRCAPGYRWEGGDATRGGAPVGFRSKSGYTSLHSSSASGSGESAYAGGGASGGAVSVVDAVAASALPNRLVDALCEAERAARLGVILAAAQHIEHILARALCVVVSVAGQMVGEGVDVNTPLQRVSAEGGGRVVEGVVLREVQRLLEVGANPLRTLLTNIHDKSGSGSGMTSGSSSFSDRINSPLRSPGGTSNAGPYALSNLAARYGAGRGGATYPCQCGSAAQKLGGGGGGALSRAPSLDDRVADLYTLCGGSVAAEAVGKLGEAVASPCSPTRGGGSDCAANFCGQCGGVLGPRRGYGGGGTSPASCGSPDSFVLSRGLHRTHGLNALSLASNTSCRDVLAVMLAVLAWNPQYAHGGSVLHHVGMLCDHKWLARSVSATVTLSNVGGVGLLMAEATADAFEDCDGYYYASSESGMADAAAGGWLCGGFSERYDAGGHYFTPNGGADGGVGAVLWSGETESSDGDGLSGGGQTKTVGASDGDAWLQAALSDVVPVVPEVGGPLGPDTRPSVVPQPPTRTRGWAPTPRTYYDDPTAAVLEGSRVGLTVVLDLDETLGHLDRDNRVILVRPFAHALLHRLHTEGVELVAWTAADRAWCEIMLSRVDPGGLIKIAIHRGPSWFTKARDLNPKNVALISPPPLSAHNHPKSPFRSPTGGKGAYSPHSPLSTGVLSSPSASARAAHPKHCLGPRIVLVDNLSCNIAPQQLGGLCVPSFVGAEGDAALCRVGSCMLALAADPSLTVQCLADAGRLVTKSCPYTRAPHYCLSDQTYEYDE